MPLIDLAAGVIVFRISAGGGREYLVIKNAAGHWELPKGHLKTGEHWHQAAVRELQEETGLTPTRVFAGFSREIRYVFRDRRRGIVQKTVRFLLGQVDAPAVQLSCEHTDFAYLPLHQATPRLTHAVTRQLLCDAEIYIQNHMSA